MNIDPPPTSTPPPVSAVEVSYPDDLGLATSGLGIAACDPAALELQGEEACPANSKMGQGTAVVELPFGPEIVSETVTLGIYAAPSSDGYLHLAIIAHGLKPVIASIVMAGVLLPGRLQITVPAIVGVAGGPDVSLVSLQASLGGALTYYERQGAKTVSYRPRGIGLPGRCPRGGWKLAARFAFIDGTASVARTVIPCPAPSGRAKRARVRPGAAP